MKIAFIPRELFSVQMTRKKEGKVIIIIINKIYLEE